MATDPSTIPLSRNRDAGTNGPAPSRMAMAQPVAGEPRIAATCYRWRDPTTLPQLPWVFGRYFLRGVVTAVVSPGGVGKTTWLAGTALSIVSGKPLLGKAPWDGEGRVWIWNLEDDLDQLSRVIQAGALHFNLDEASLGDRLFVDSAMEGAGLSTATEQDGFKLLAPVFDAITAELIKRQIDVLIIDPFVSSHDVDENANTKIDSIAKAWGRVAKAANAAIVLVHHTRKLAGQKVTSEQSRGAVSLINAARIALVLNRMDEAEAERFGIEGDDERRRHFSVQDDKHNRAPPEKADWFRMASVELGNGDNIGVAERWTPKDAFDGLTGAHLYRVQLAIAEGEHREDLQSPAWAGNAVALVLGLDPRAKSDRGRIRKLIDAWLVEGALEIVERADATRRLRKFITVGRWQNDPSAPPSQGGAEHGGAAEQR